MNDRPDVAACVIDVSYFTVRREWLLQWRAGLDELASWSCGVNMISVLLEAVLDEQWVRAVHCGGGRALVVHEGPKMGMRAS